MTSRWHFNEMRPRDKAREPIQGEFFAAEAIDKPGEALVREGIQNSLDARRSGVKVMVRIRVSGTEGGVARKEIDHFADGLDDHIKAPGNGLRDIPAHGDSCPFLVFEDFGTTGLTGDPAEWKPAAGSRNHFYYFFRAEGRSDKSEKDIGRWGVGKQVFLRASRINSIFGLTVRADDKKRMLMGMAVLKSHDVNGTRFAPDGWLGCVAQDEMVLPIEEPSFIDCFVRTFDIQRGDDDPGLTVVVPWCDLDLTGENLVRAVLSGYFWPILRGQLDVMVEAGTLQPILDASSLEREIRKIGGDLEREILPLVELAKWTAGLGDSEFTQLGTPDASRAWQWSRDLFPQESLRSIRERYERGEKIAVRVPVTICEKPKEARQTHFDVFFVRDGSDYNGRPVYIREGIIVPDVRRHGSGVLRGVRSLVVAEDGPIASFLGDAENPAHTQWQKNGANFKGKYEAGHRILEFVTQSVIEIVRIITEQDKKEDRTLLADLFSISAPPEQEDSRTRGKKKPGRTGTGPEEPPPVIEPRPIPFTIHRIDGGFVVRSGDADGGPSPSALSIRAAYQVRRGNPFRKYHRADFDFSHGMKTRLTGATILEKKENRLRVKVSSRDFHIEVAGFDPRRDVRVEVRPEEEGDAGPDA